MREMADTHTPTRATLTRRYSASPVICSSLSLSLSLALSQLHHVHTPNAYTSGCTRARVTKQKRYAFGIGSGDTSRAITHRNDRHRTSDISENALMEPAEKKPRGTKENKREQERGKNCSVHGGCSSVNVARISFSGACNGDKTRNPLILIRWRSSWSS